MNVNYNDITALIEASLDANYSEVRSVSNRIAKAISAQDLEAAKKIKSILRRKGVPLRSSGYLESLPVDPKSRSPLIEEQQWPVSPLFLDQKEQEVFRAFIDSVNHQDKLIENGISSRLNLLLSGAPGTGKTLVAGHIAAQLNKTLYVVRLDSVISSLLGDTAKNIRQIFEYVPSKDAVLFLDEVDAVAKLRDDSQEIGELKRVVNTLIQGLDSLDDKAIVIAATNHANLLDPAIWRRFPFKINFELPSLDVRDALWDHFLFQDKGDKNTRKILSVISNGLTGADIENISISSRRQSVLSGKELNVASVVHSIINSKIDNPVVVLNEELNINIKKEISKKLHEQYEFSQAEIGRLLNVSRQTVSVYLKE
ncbi:AAA family ATPase [Pectobacterium brasiliense]|uniref:AAA family ATPase n=1 Tax=Pectobacterium TaxID=122277 RepID=UPI000E709C21|nr:ATP-binding protein [Pectobacterium carotovorum]RJL48415.1 ATP-binding protein [Pectobacterium carotovorum]